MNNLTGTFIWLGVLAVAFILAWRAGYVVRFRDYVLETREELKKCTWPTWDELKGSTLLVTVSILLLGLFTMGVDFICNILVRTFI